jgi:transcriptional regulator of acetoin/glycerol metabolism
MAASATSTIRLSDSSVAQRSGGALAILWVWPRAARFCDRLTDPPIEVGRKEGCRIRLDSGSVSRRHAEIYRQGPVFVIRDLASTNGTRLNGKHIQHSALSAGDVLRIGDYVGVVARAPAGDESPMFGELAPGLLGGYELAAWLAPLMRVAPSGLPILVEGETGTGKECVARALHHFSGRKGPFHAVNCAAVPPSLAEAELFGHREGAFTGAVRANEGHFRAAHGGTLFLDEAGELSLSVQAKLLRALEERAILPLGHTRAIPIDVQVVSAAQRSVRELVREKVFREDLLARLAGMTVTLPPLRQRRADVLPLFTQFLAEHSGGRPPVLTPQFAEVLCLHEWPQNIRELEQLARRLLALHGAEPTLRRSYLPEELTRKASSDTVPPALGAFESRREHDLHSLAEALRRTRGNVKAAAAHLGFSRQRAYRLMDGHTATQLMALRNGHADSSPGDPLRDPD